MALIKFFVDLPQGVGDIAGDIDPREDPGAFLAKVKRRFIDGEE